MDRREDQSFWHSCPYLAALFAARETVQRLEQCRRAGHRRSAGSPVAQIRVQSGHGFQSVANIASPQSLMASNLAVSIEMNLHPAGTRSTILW